MINFKQRPLPLIIFGGYSHSGKTTYCIPILRSLGYQILSSSILMHDFTDRLVNLLGCTAYDSYNRELQLSVSSKATTKKSNSFFKLNKVAKGDYQAYSRDLMIDLANQVLIPVFSRAVFCDAIADVILQNPSVCYAVEIYNHEEFNYLKSRLVADKTTGGEILFNLRRHNENPSLDDRSLIPGAVNIYNNGSYAELEFELEALILESYR